MSTPTQNMTSKNTPAFSDPANTWNQRFAAPGFLFGAEPCAADFAAYHPLWFTRQCVPVMADIFQATPAVLEWMDRVAALGHGRMEKFSAADAITVAAGAEPIPVVDDIFQNEHGIALGSRVTIAAESFGTEPTEGELIAAISINQGRDMRSLRQLIARRARQPAEVWQDPTRSLRELAR